MGAEAALPPRVEEAPAGTLEEALRREPAESAFECNVCLELASDPVITLCGHLYCWPCLYRCAGGCLARSAVAGCVSLPLEAGSGSGQWWY